MAMIRHRVLELTEITSGTSGYIDLQSGDTKADLAKNVGHWLLSSLRSMISQAKGSPLFVLDFHAMDEEQFGLYNERQMHDELQKLMKDVTSDSRS